LLGRVGMWTAWGGERQHITSCISSPSSLHILLIARSSSLASRSSFASASVSMGGCCSASAAAFLTLRDKHVTVAESGCGETGAHLSGLEPGLAVAACFIRRSCLRSLLGPYFLQNCRRFSSNGLVARVELGKKVVHEVIVVVVVVVGGGVVDDIGIGVVCWWGSRRKDLFDFVLFGTHAVGVRTLRRRVGREMTASPHTHSGPVTSTTLSNLINVCSDTNSSSTPSAISGTHAAATTAVPDAPRSTRASRGPAYLAT
jgi:hypothetical protein